MAPIRSKVDENHPDYSVLSLLRDEINRRVGGASALKAKFPELVRQSVDFLLDSVTTARTRVVELDNVEKTFVGLKLEHFVRDLLDVPKGLRDLRIADMDVDIKNTVQNNWSIPQETYSSAEPCLLMMINDEAWQYSLGLIVARPEYLHGGRGNRDTKKGVSAEGKANILWLAEREPFPPSRFIGLDMDRFRELRKSLRGTQRVAQFFRENVDKVVHRDVLKALLFDQDDYMKRIRGNGGARDILKWEGIAILVGTFKSQREMASLFGFDKLASDEVVAISPKNLEDWQLMNNAGFLSGCWSD